MFKGNKILELLTRIKRANQNLELLNNCRNCRRLYAGNWELVKSIMGIKFGRSHVCLHSQAGNRLVML